MLDHFLKTTAVMLFAGCFDQLTGWNPHNYYIYRHPKTGRWSYIPWDLDVGFADHAFGQIPVIDGWNAAWPIPGGPPKPILENITADPKLLKKYRELASVILDKYFKPEKLQLEIDQHYSLIKKRFSQRSISSQTRYKSSWSRLRWYCAVHEEIHEKTVSTGTAAIGQSGAKTATTRSAITTYSFKGKTGRKRDEAMGRAREKPQQNRPTNASRVFPNDEGGECSGCRKIDRPDYGATPQGLKPLRPNNLPK